MKAYCVHCGHNPHVWWHHDTDGSYAAIGDHYPDNNRTRPHCPGSGARLHPDRTPPLQNRTLHRDDCLTPTGITCVCPLQAHTTSKEYDS